MSATLQRDPAKRLRLAGACLLFALLLIAGLADHAGAMTTARAEIVFESGGRVMSIDPDGAGRTTLTAGKTADDDLFESELAPAIAPDGRLVAWMDRVQPNRGPSFQRLVVADRDGRNPVALMSTRGKANRFAFYSIDWSPQGRLLLVEYIGPGKSVPRATTRVLSMNPDGTERRVEASRSVHQKRGRVMAKEGAYILEVAAAPDGRSLLLGTWDSLGADSQLEILDLESGRSRVVRRNAEDGAWSPDGSRIVFSSTRTGSKRHRAKLFVIRTDGTGARKLTRIRGAAEETGAAWSPDGSRIAFASTRNAPDTGEEGREIYSISPDGSCLTWLTNGTPAAFNPEWGPETDRDPAPVTCGQTDRRPVVDLVPDPNPIVNGEPTKWPRLWLGPVFRRLGQSMSPDDGRSLVYSDCVRFDPSDCSRIAYTVDSDDVCLRWVEQLASFGETGQVKLLRGALVFLPNPNRRGSEETVVLTGGQAVMIASYALRPNLGSFVSDHLDAVERLRPVGGSATADLAPPVVSRGLVKGAGRFASAVKRAGSVASAARKLREKPAVVRSWLRIHRALKKNGPFKQVSCRGWI